MSLELHIRTPVPLPKGKGRTSVMVPVSIASVEPGDLAPAAKHADGGIEYWTADGVVTDFVGWRRSVSHMALADRAVLAVKRIVEVDFGLSFGDYANGLPMPETIGRFEDFVDVPVVQAVQEAAASLRICGDRVLQRSIGPRLFVHADTGSGRLHWSWVRHGEFDFAGSTILYRGNQMEEMLEDAASVGRPVVQDPHFGRGMVELYLPQAFDFDAMATTVEANAARIIRYAGSDRLSRTSRKDVASVMAIRNAVDSRFAASPWPLSQTGGYLKRRTTAMDDIPDATELARLIVERTDMAGWHWCNKVAVQMLASRVLRLAPELEQLRIV